MTRKWQGPPAIPGSILFDEIDSLTGSQLNTLGEMLVSFGTDGFDWDKGACVRRRPLRMEGGLPPLSYEWRVECTASRREAFRTRGIIERLVGPAAGHEFRLTAALLASLNRPAASSSEAGYRAAVAHHKAAWGKRPTGTTSLSAEALPFPGSPGIAPSFQLTGIEMAPIPAGKFLMGSPEDEEGRYPYEGPQHTVHLSGFEMGRVPVTQQLWESVMGSNPARFKGSPHRPVAGVSWFDAVRFCNALSEREGLPTAYTIGTGEAPDVARARGAGGFRLPTEAEWEYACRAGTPTRYWSGDKEEDLARVGWYSGNAGGTTHPVGEKPANPWGLYDMLGNVHEWCYDFSSRPIQSYTSQARTNPVQRAGGFRAHRGGSWLNTAQFVRAAYRSGNAPDNRFVSLGFRLARGGSNG